MNSKNDFKKDLLAKEELAMVKGGKMEASSSQLTAVELGKESCCNITIKF